MRALIVLSLFLAATVLASDQTMNRSRRQMFSSSGLVFPGPPRRRGPQPSAQQTTQLKINSDESSAISVTPTEAPAQRPYVRRSETRENPEASVASSRPQERSSVDRQVPPLLQSIKEEEVKPSLPIPQAQYRPRQPVQIDEEEEEEASSEVYGDSARPSQQETAKWQEYERPQQYQQRRPAPKPQVRRPNYPEGYRPIQPQSVRGNNVEPERSRRPPERDYEEEREKDNEEDFENEEEEEHKPDKLQMMLMKSEFNCIGRKNGYYADEGLECEIFHYCADGVMHSWLCPEGASFHQVHLICMPVNKENICKKSSQFHFVNDYLYQPIDDDGNTDNSSSIYADRYYPDGYEHGAPFDMSKVNEPEEIRYQAFNRREDGYTNNNNNNNNNPETRGRERPQPTQQRPLRRRPATDPRQRIFNSNRRQGVESERPSPVRPYQSAQISEDELASHNLDPKDDEGYQIRRRVTRPVRPAFSAETEEEDDE